MIMQSTPTCPSLPLPKRRPFDTLNLARIHLGKAETLLAKVFQ
jgi:hypothetical protein